MNPTHIMAFFGGLAVLYTMLLATFVTWALRDEDEDTREAKAEAWDLGYQTGYQEAEEEYEALEEADEESAEDAS